jgi:amino acid adenylation domain-containing protein/FkbM family methyltransferase
MKKTDIQNIYSLSPMQEGMLFHWLKDRNSTAYMEQAIIRLKGDVDEHLVKRAIAMLSDRHDVLRTIFTYKKTAKPRQILLKKIDIPVVVHDLGGEPSEGHEAILRDFIQQDRRQGFHLGKGPLLRIALFNMDGRYTVVWSFHHIIMDGWCLEALFEDVSFIYRQLARGRKPEPMTTTPYIQYIRWLERQDSESGIAYWKHYLEGIDEPSAIPQSPPEGHGDSYLEASQQLELPRELVDKIGQLAKTYHSTLNQFCRAAWAVLLSRYSRRQDLVFGAVVSGRPPEIPGVQRMVGLFINTIPVRIKICGQDSFRNVLRAVGDDTLASGPHEYLPLARIQALSPLRDSLIDHIFVFEDFPLAAAPKDDSLLRAEGVEFIERTVYRFNIQIVRHGDQLQLKAVFDASCYSRPYIQRLLGHLENVLRQTVDAVDIPCRSIDIFSPLERRNILHRLSRHPGDRELPEQGVLELFYKQVEERPHRVALHGRSAIDGYDTFITYRHLAVLARRVESRLRKMSTVAGSIVGLMSRRTVETMFGMLGILGLGAAYLPIDPSLPSGRISFMLDDSNAAAVLDCGDLVARYSEPKDGGGNGGSSAAIDPNSLFYIIYTSGSTGTPKGVALEHRQLRNYIQGISAVVDFSCCRHYAVVSTMGADLGNTVIFKSLASGGSLHIMAEEIVADAGMMGRAMVRRQVDCLKLTPSHMAALLSGSDSDSVLPRKVLIMGGETLPPSLVEDISRLSQNLKIYNHYGPTEACIGVTAYETETNKEQEQVIPIGRPFPNIEIYLLGRGDEPVPIGAPGELCVAGANLARGYLNRPELTHGSFFHLDDDKRIYRTGDLARFREDGNLEFLERMDQQIKIRGYRVETGEIEQCLRQSPIIDQAVVKAVKEADSGLRLDAYVKPHPLHLPEIYGHKRYLLPNHLAVAHLNKNETDYIYREIFQLQAYSRFGISYEDGATILDIGGNIGLFSLYAGARCRNPRIYTFEPNPTVFELLRANAELYLPEARLFNCGISSVDGELPFTFLEGFSLLSGLYVDQEQEREMVLQFMKNQGRAGAEGMDRLLTEAEDILEQRFKSKTFQVPIRTVSSVMDQNGIQRVDLLKINVEKAELDVLKGISPQHWQRIRQVVLEVDVDTHIEPITGILERHGFEWLLDQDLLLEGTQLYYIYAIRSGPKGCLLRDQHECLQPIPRLNHPFEIEEAIRDTLLQRLPSYMIPANIYIVDHIPLTANGKVDRRALTPGAVAGKKRRTRPRNDMEKELVEIWADILSIKVETIGIDDNFFDKGGHSLRATILAARVNKQFDTNFPIRVVFDHPTVRSLGGFLEREARGGHRGIQPVEKKEYYPLAPAQQRLYVIEQLGNAGTTYNMFMALTIGGSLDRQRLESVFCRLVERHDSFRTSFVTVHGRPVQRIHPQAELKLDIIDDPNYEFVRPFELSQPPLLRVGLRKTGESEHLLLVDMHHIISDGTSMGIIINDLIRLYNDEPLNEPYLQYRDYAVWQHELEEAGALEKQKQYWLDCFPTRIPRLELPTDFPRPAELTFNGDRLLFHLDRQLSEELLRHCRQHGVTLFMSLLAAMSALFFHYAGQEDIVVGTGVMGRPHSDTADIVGMFINALALRIFPAKESLYSDFLLQLKSTCIAAFDNQDAQFEEVVDRLGIQRDPSRNPLFDVMMVVQNFQQPSGRVQGVTFAPLEKTEKTSKFDMTLFAFHDEDRVRFKWEYNTALFKEATIRRMAGHLVSILRQCTGSSRDLPIGDVDVLSPDEKRRIIVLLNQTESTLPASGTITSLFLDRAEENPYGTAIGGGEPEMHLSFDCLRQKAEEVALFLQTQARGEGVTFAAILMERGIDCIVSIMGTLLAGWAYLPIDPSFPQRRVRRMLEDVGAPVLFGHKKFIRLINHLHWECKCLRHVLVMDSADAMAEPEKEQSQLMERELWEYVGETATDDITGGGWQDSFTGLPFSRREMDEYGDNVLGKLKPLIDKETRILEIGSASGITMFRLAPLVGFYFGCDLSSSITERNRLIIDDEGMDNIQVACLAAHQIDEMDDGDFDIVIINSVIQCFHGHNYLRHVLNKAVAKMKPRGYIFAGDIMDIDLKDQLEQDLKHSTKNDWSTELFLSRDFFEDLTNHMPGVRGVEFSGKIHTIENELTRYRYDALITVDKENNDPRGGSIRHKYLWDRCVLAETDSNIVNPAVSPGDPAYIIFTSGSTGVPKGTLITHQNVLRLVIQTNYLTIRPWDRVLQLSNTAFDGSVFDIFAPLVNGATLVPFTNAEGRGVDVVRLGNFLKQRHISVSLITTALFNTLVELDIDCFAGVRKILFGGEQGSLVHTRRALGRLGPERLINAYGPTEATVIATFYPVNHIPGKATNVPIGKPISNTSVYVLNQQLKPQPYGVPGELWIGGRGLAAGYLNNPLMTAERFILWKGNGKAERLYRSGDLVRLLPDDGGQIEFIGRVDRQVKIRGFRIELSEIEHCLADMNQVREAVVLAVDAPGGEKTLEAWFVPADNFSGDGHEVKGQLAGQCPEFMIPSHITAIPKIPLTSNGKVDRRKLMALRETEEVVCTRPGTLTEEALLRIWSSLLAVPEHSISMNGDFFQMGGHSLKATMLVVRIQQELGIKLPLSEVFRAPRIRQLAKIIDSQPRTGGPGIRPMEKRDYYPLSSAQQRMYILQQSVRRHTGYNMPAMFQLSGPLDARRVALTFDLLIRRHESLRTSFEEVDETPVQRIRDYVGFKVQQCEGEVEEAIQRFIRPFPLDEAPLMRVGLTPMEGEMHLLLADIHHIVSDGISMGILIEEFMELYRGRELEPPYVQYRDFALWEEDFLRSDLMKRQEDYWLDRFKDPPPPLDLPLDSPRPLTRRFSGETVYFRLNADITGNLRRMCREADVTMFMTVSSLLRILLAKLCGQMDVVLGTPVSGRGSGPLEKVVGMFVNTLALRSGVLWDCTFRDYLAVVKPRTIEDFSNQDFPFERLVEQVDRGRRSGRNPLFDVMFSFQNLDIPRFEIPDMVLEPYHFGVNRALFDLTFKAAEVADCLHMAVEYSDELFNRETVQRLFVEGFEVLVEDALGRPNVDIRGLAFVPADEKTSSVSPNPTVNQLAEDCGKRTASTSLQKKLAEIWAGILGIDFNTIGPDSDFFLLGGHSLRATRLIARLRKQLTVDLTLEEIFLHSTIRRQATYIQSIPGCAPEPVEYYETLEHYPLSGAQQRIYSAWKQSPDSVVYNMPVAMKLEGTVDIPRLSQCFQRLYNRHDSFRTSYFLQDGELRQRIVDDYPLVVEAVDIDTFIRPFDLKKPPLLRVSIEERAPDEHLLLVDMHHIASDGTSIGILVRELANLYNDGNLPPLEFQYRDYALRQHRFPKDRPIEWSRQKDFWSSILEGELPATALPFDYPKSNIREFSGGEIHFQMDGPLTLKLQNIAAVHGTTMFAVLLALFNVLLARMSNRQDIIVGTAAAGRELDEWQDIVGMFVNTLPLRNFPKDELAFADFLAAVGERSLAAFRHQDLHLEEMFGPPPFDVFFVYQNMEMPRVAIGDVQVDFVPMERTTAKFDLLLDVTLGDGQLHAGLEFNDRIFKRRTVEGFVRYMFASAEAVAEDPSQRIGEIELLTSEEKKDLLSLCNGPVLDLDLELQVIQSFERQGTMHPDGVALTFADRNISYRSLNRMAESLARQFPTGNASYTPITAICLSDMPMAIAAMLAVLKAGSAFLMIPVEYPAARKKRMLVDSYVKLLIGDEGLPADGRWIPDNVAVLEPQPVDPEVGNIPLFDRMQDSAGQLPLYAVYTSGSTGTPRGVLIPNRVMANLIAFQLRYTSIEFSRVTQFASMGFDVAVQEIFTTFAAGGTLVALDHGRKNDSRYLLDVVGKNCICSLFLPTAFFKILANNPLWREGCPSCILHIVVAGERLTLAPEAIAFLETNKIHLHNHYGPSETHVVTAWTIAPNDKADSLPPIGAPVANSRVLVLNRRGMLQPAGVPGELWVAGPAVGLGYLNSQEHTRQRFTNPNPNLSADTDWYRTGDLARLKANGVFEYLGRIDRQLKIHGFRVEPAEIEAALLSHDLVEEAVVLSREELDGQNTLIAYITGASTLEAEIGSLESSLKGELPSYMIPRHLVVLNEIPLTPSGKVDRRALPLPEFRQLRNCEPPANPIERQLLQLWSQVLGIREDSFGVTDDFFSLGGHSLKATMLAARVQHEMEAEFPFHAIFRHPTIRRQADFIAASAPKSRVSFEPLERMETYPLSPAQRRIFLLQQMVGERPVYNMPFMFKLESAPDEQKIQRSFEILVRRHESLRTSFVEVDGEGRQKIHQEVDVRLAHLESPDDWPRPFDLTGAPLMRVGLTKNRDGEDLLLMDIHHIVCDGISLAVIMEEFQAFYRGETLPEPLLHYKDVAIRQIDNRHTDYWLRQLDDLPAALQLPVDMPGGRHDFSGGVAFSRLDAAETVALKEMAESGNCTYFMVLITIYILLLYKLSGQEDIIVGAPTSGRHHPQSQRCVGMFVNTLALRFKPRGRKTVADFLTEVKETSLAAFAHQDAPFEELVERLGVTRDPSRNPLFDVMFTLDNVGTATSVPAPELSLQPLDIMTGTAKFHLTLGAVEQGNETLLTFEYSDRLFKGETISTWASYFKRIASQLPSSLERQLSDIDLLAPRQKRELVQRLTGPECQEAKQLELTAIFRRQCLRTPDRIAILYPESNLYISYRECFRGAEAIAGGLGAMRIGPGQVVAIPVADPLPTIIAMLGVLLIGAAYLPLDISLPSKRVDYMLQDANVCCLLESDSLAPGSWDKELPPPIDPLAPAYIIYTSGSTGTPKGVIIPRSAVVRIARENGYIQLDQNDRVLQWSNLAFDGSVFDVFGALLNGAALVTVSPAIRMSVDLLGESILKEAVTVFFITTAMFNVLVDECLPDLRNLRHLLFGGERVSLPHTRRALDYLSAGTVIHVYGPTETTVFATHHPIHHIHPNDATVPIGLPVANTSIHILDAYRRDVPPGVTGEIWIGGDGLALGYVNRPEEMSETFKDGLYRSGDLGRLNAEGAIEFVGRKDRQLKIRGFRIELGEIEHRLRSHQGVRDAVVIAREDSSLAAYVVAERDLTLDMEELLRFIAGLLPSYMVPAYFIELEKIPVTSNGKVDRALLPAPDTSGREVIMPQTPVQRRLADLWRQVLAIDCAIGIEDDFFVLGGHSIKASVMLRRVREVFGVVVPLAEFFGRATIGFLGEFVDSVDFVDALDRRLVLLRGGADSAGALFLIHAGSGDVDGYLEFCRLLELGCPCYGIRVDSGDYPFPQETSIEAIAEEYLALVRAVQPSGPYRLAGWCIGGTIAFEMAVQLEELGETVEFLGLINSSPPGFRLEDGAVLPSAASLESLTKESLLKALPSSWKQAIPGVDELSRRELLGYISIILSLDRARNIYVPGAKVDAALHYMVARDFPIKGKEQWIEFSARPIRFYEVRGDHFSIFSDPGVRELADIVNRHNQR